MPSEYIDVLDPVADHDLNRGLVAWWLGLENLSGGNTLYDIKRCPGYDGTLTNGPTWTTSPNGFGSVVFDGSNDFGSYTPPSSLTDFFVSMWMNPVSNTADDSTYWWENFPSTPRNCVGFTPRKSAGSPGQQWECYVGGTGGIVADTGGGSTVGTPVWVCLSRSGTSATGYVNGVQLGSPITVGSGSFSPLNGRFGCHYFSGTNNQYLNAAIWDIRLYSRALNVSDIQELYAQSRQQYPDLLRRVSSRAWMLGVEQGGGATTLSASGALAGYGLLGGTASKRVSVPGIADGIGNIAGVPTAKKSALSEIVGSGVVSGGPSVVVSVDGTVVGVGTTTGSVSQVSSAPSAIVGVGEVTGIASILSSSVGTVIGYGVDIGNAAARLSAQSSVIGSGTVVASPSVQLSASGSLVGYGEITGSGAITVSTTGSLSGYGLFVATNDNSITISAAGAIAGYGVVAATPKIAASVTGALTGVGEVTTPAAVKASSIGALSGYGEMTNSPSIFCAAHGVLSGYGVVNGAGSYTVAVVGCITGYGVLYGRTTSTSYHGPVYGTLSVIPEVSGTLGVRPGVAGVLATRPAINGTLAVKPPRR